MCARKRQPSEFSKNVAANVAANVILFSVGYLAGAVLGIFPHTPESIIIIVFLVLMAGIFVAGIASNALPGDKKDLAFSAAVILFGMWFATPGISSLLSDSDIPLGVAVLMIWWGTSFSVVGIILSRRYLQLRRRRLHDERRINGLFWIEH